MTVEVTYRHAGTREEYRDSLVTIVEECIENEKRQIDWLARKASPRYRIKEHRAAIEAYEHVLHVLQNTKFE